MQSKLSPLHHLYEIPKIRSSSLYSLLQFTASISSLKVVWRKDPKLDEAVEKDKKWRLCARVVREVLNEPGSAIALRYLEKRRERLRLPVRAETFTAQNPGLFDTYKDRIKPNSDLTTFIRPSIRLNKFLEDEQAIYSENESHIVAKLCKLLMMSKHRVINVDKLVEVKRDFGFPNDFIFRFVSKYPEYFRLIGVPGEGKSFLELVSWNEEFAKSVIEKRAEEESKLIGIRTRPGFDWKLPRGFCIRKEMREWVRDWTEMPYISPYEDVSHLEPASREMEKRMVGVLHELLSLSVFRRIPVATIGKFCEDYRFSNAFSSAFTRHSGIFYMSLKQGIQTAMLREAYVGGELVDRDPLLQIKDKFVEMLEEGHKQRAEWLRLRRESVQNEMEMAARKNLANNL